MAAPTNALFKPIKVGAIELQHRVVLAPLTRIRAGKNSHIPTLPLMKEYYNQRASRPGTLVITEGTLIAAQAAGRDNVPGIWSQDQINAWKEITDSIHTSNSFVFLQIRALGRAATPTTLESKGYPYVAPSPIAYKSRPTPVPRELTLSEIHEYTNLFAQAARNAREAGCDGVELHGANGYLLDQFLQDVSNQRSDEYGGSIENRSRFGLEVISAVVEAIGAERVGIRLSPWSKFQDMRMENPIPQFSHFVSSLKKAHPDLAYIHVVEPETEGTLGKMHGPENLHLGNDSDEESNDFLRAIWKPKPFISCGGYIRESALIRAEDKGDIIAFGRWFIANPDLSYRLQYNIPLTEYNRETFYVPAEDPKTAVGYIDYPFATGKVNGKEDESVQEDRNDFVHTRTSLQ
ncbi:hypothetical protein BDQ17DRAFT_1356769 [Cyathus striatus]|nr:hypothetical protein BDQ17DRAFT_1356769 [Cyathus striatus]